MENTVKYIEISKGLSIGVPVNLSQEEIDKRVEKYKNNLENAKCQHYNPHKKRHVKSKF
ncbi:hypothetical protein [Pedobacter ureilyticus]|uniref:Uncharacterized protein n=1 Tax=Pedobacter ureilyticus TaxID=1393051 RepID=A0ABW9J1T4_9SPHI|nr:hypothetical protein [Pedobacter helvus]